jgi:dienelactone hydrolase
MNDMKTGKRARPLGRARIALAAATIAAGWALAPAAYAQADKMTPIAIPAQPDAITLDTGPLPGATVNESWHSQYGSVFARNVTVATLTPFLPDPAKATGAAVIVAPGGGFRTLSMQNEGWDVARALAARGVAAFVLKYRLNQTPRDMAGFEESMRAMFAGVAGSRPAPETAADRLAPQIADARAAFALVRKRATEWRVDPNRIGMVGFSAGAMLTVATTLKGEDAKPAFIGDIYGPRRRRCSSRSRPTIRCSAGSTTGWSTAGARRRSRSNSTCTNRAGTVSACIRRRRRARAGSRRSRAGCGCTASPAERCPQAPRVDPARVGAAGPCGCRDRGCRPVVGTVVRSTTRGWVPPLPFDGLPRRGAQSSSIVIPARAGRARHDP